MWSKKIFDLIRILMYFWSDC